MFTLRVPVKIATGEEKTALQLRADQIINYKLGVYTQKRKETYGHLEEFETNLPAAETLRFRANP
jgi:hypothetical protein